MEETTVAFVRDKKIDSYIKLNILLFLHKYPEFNGTSEQLARHLHLGDTLLIEKTIQELRAAGLLECVKQQCRLPKDKSLKSLLHNLNLIYSDPLARQKLLSVVKRINSFNADGV